MNKTTNAHALQPGTKPAIQYEWRAQGEPNQYVILRTDFNIDASDLRHKDWFATIQFNGDIASPLQEEYMNSMIEYLTKNYQQNH